MVSVLRMLLLPCVCLTLGGSGGARLTRTKSQEQCRQCFRADLGRMDGSQDADLGLDVSLVDRAR